MPKDIFTYVFDNFKQLFCDAVSIYGNYVSNDFFQFFDNADFEEESYQGFLDVIQPLFDKSATNDNLFDLDNVF